jgi:hypothetical protein
MAGLDVEAVSCIGRAQIVEFYALETSNDLRV